MSRFRTEQIDFENEWLFWSFLWCINLHVGCRYISPLALIIIIICRMQSWLWTPSVTISPQFFGVYSPPLLIDATGHQRTRTSSLMLQENSLLAANVYVLWNPMTGKKNVTEFLFNTYFHEKRDEIQNIWRCTVNCSTSRSNSFGICLFFLLLFCLSVEFIKWLHVARSH